MNNTRAIIFVCLVSFYFQAHSAETENPSYCEPNQPAPTCNVKNLKSANQNLKGILNLANSLKEQDFKNNLKNTAILKLLEKKRDLLAPYPGIYPNTDSSHKFYYSGLGHKKKRSGHAGRQDLYAYQKTCLNKSPNVIKRLDNMEKSFKSKRKKESTDEFQINHLASLLLGAIASEKGIEQRPVISKDIEKLEGNIRRMDKKIALGDAGKVSSNTSRGTRFYSSPCKRNKSSRSCEKFKKQLESSKKYKSKLENQLKVLNSKRDLIDKTIFENPFYAKARDLEDSVKNTFQNKNLGDYKKSSFLSNSLVALKELKNGKEIKEAILEKIVNTKGYEKQSGGVSGVAMGQVLLVDLLKSNKNLKNKVKRLYLKELRGNLVNLNDSVNKICKSGGEGLYKVQGLVDLVRTELIAGSELKNKNTIDFSGFLSEYQKTHCAILKKEQNKKILGMSKLILTQIGAGVVTLGAGIATGFGCVPCLGVAISAGGIATGLGVADAINIQSESDSLQGLASLKLVEQKRARELLRDAQAGWLFVGVDIALTPLGLKGGAVIRVGKTINAGKKELKGLELANNKDFFNSMGHGIDQKDFKKIMKDIKKLSPEKQQMIAKDLSDLGDMKEAERLTLIANVMKKNGIDFPDGKLLNNSFLKKLEKNPKMLAKIKKDYKSEMIELKIKEGTPDEEAFIRIAGILENQGCFVGICKKKMVSKAEVVAEYKRRIGSCSI